MDGGNAVPVGLCILPQPAANCPRTCSYPTVIEDVLTHYGIPFSSLQPHSAGEALADLAVLVTVGEAAPGLLPDLAAWIEAGGTWIAVAGTGGNPDLLGVEPEPPAYGSWGGGLGMLGERWLRPTVPSPLTEHLRIPLHYFNGVAVRVKTDKCVLAVEESHAAAREGKGRPLIVERKLGKGSVLLLAPDIPGTMVRIRQGIAVTRDGVPAPDGTAPICDGVLKSDDGAVLDWIRDRQQVPGVDGYTAFLEPIADLWAELLIRAILHGAARANVALPVLWLYPRNLPMLAVLSHDSDGNDPAKAEAMLKVVAEAGIRTTWCVMSPGYPVEIVEAVRAAGHELAMHFDAMSEGTYWSEDDFQTQWLTLCQLFDEAPRTNKNHYLRWEGDLEFLDWCAKRGILVDQSKGASKTGEAGFNFGTCHIFRPVRRDGSMLDVWEMPTPTQDLMVFAPVELGDALHESVARHHGVLHLLFHPAHIQTEGVADALLRAVRLVQNHGGEWWTAKEVAAWETARVGCRWSHWRREAAGRVTAVLEAPSGLRDATVLWLDAGGKVERWGLHFTAQTVTVAEGQRITLQYP